MLKYARLYRANLISLRCGLENAQELAACCGAMGEEFVTQLEKMIGDTRKKIEGIEALLRQGVEENENDHA